jgi:hypothetical protein
MLPEEPVDYRNAIVALAMRTNEPMIQAFRIAAIVECTATRPKPAAIGKLDHRVVIWRGA